jgi:hypothetical protein
MLCLNHIKITPRAMSKSCNCRCSGATEHQPEDGETTSADSVPASRNPGQQKTSQAGKRYVRKGANRIMQPRERLTAKEMQVVVPVWEGQTNRERNTFDRRGVWSRLELAIYVARHGGERWREELTMKPIHIFSGTIAS